MATITTDTYLDDGTARSAGESWTMNGARLTIRTDSRWHVGAPASMTGSLSSLTVSSTLGGGVTIDGRDVRWLAYDTGTGNVPAIGTTVSQGGVSGYLLGVWSGLTAAPTAVGAAMPATGWLKFRSVTSGPFAAGALTGIGANATGADVTGWVEVVCDQSAGIVIPRLGDFTCRGAWYEAGMTDGTAGQTIQLPTNGGGSGTMTPGVWVEDSAGSDTYSFWPALNGSTNGWSRLHLGVPDSGTGERGDVRQQFVKDNGGGQIQFGETGTQAATYSLTSNVVTVTFTSHGWVVGTKLYLNFTSGTAPDGEYVIQSTTTNTFTVSLTSGNTSGNVTVQYCIGSVPVDGLRVRVPNIFLRQCTAGARASNAAPHATIATRPELSTSSAGVIDMESVSGDWYLNMLQPYSVSLVNVASFDALVVSECATPFVLTNVGVGMTAALDQLTCSITSCLAGGTVSGCCFQRGNTPGTSDHAMSLSLCLDVTIEGTRAGIIQYARSTGYAFALATCQRVVIEACNSINSAIGVSLITCSDVEVLDLDTCDRYMGVTPSGSGYCVAATTGSQDVLVDGITFGFGGTVPLVQPGLGLASVTSSKDITVRNAGSRTTPLNGGAVGGVAAGITDYIIVPTTTIDVLVQRCYVSGLSQGISSDANSDTGLRIENCGDTSNADSLLSLNSKWRGCRYTNSVLANVAVYGSHWSDLFLSDTTGRVVLYMHEPTAETAAYYDAVAGTPRFTSAGQITMQAVDDEAIWEMPYFALGHTGFANANATVTGTNVTYVSGPDYGNHDIYYQIDVNDGNGWNGSWKDLTGANLSGETIDPALGFKLKFRVVCDTAATTNAITAIRIDTVSTLTAQVDNLYPLDLYDLVLTGLQNPSEVRVFDAANPTVEIAGQETVTSGTFTAQVDPATYPDVIVAVLSLGYQNIRLTGIDMSAGNVTIPIQQQVDRQYLNP